MLQYDVIDRIRPQSQANDKIIQVEQKRIPFVFVFKLLLLLLAFVDHTEWREKNTLTL